jgi:hypothetical protein
MTGEMMKVGDMRTILALALVLCSAAAMAQGSSPAGGAPPTVGGKPLVQVKPRNAAPTAVSTAASSEAPNPAPKPKSQAIAHRLQACLELDDGTKGRLDCYDGVFPPKPNPKAKPAKGVADCRFTKEEDERLKCYNGFAESIPKF